VNALAVAPTNPEQLAAAIGRLLSDDGLCVQLARTARREVEARYTVLRYTDDLAAELKGVADRSRRGADPSDRSWRAWLRRLALPWRMRQRGRGARLHRTARVFHPDRVAVGRDCELRAESYLIGNTADPRGIQLGDGIVIGRQAYVSATDGFVAIGDDSSIGARSVLYGNGGLTIGRRVRIGHGVGISTVGHRYDDPTRPIAEQGLTLAPIHIADDAIVGNRAVIVAGVTIGAGAVVEPGSVVTRDVPAHTRVAGIPAVAVNDTDETFGGLLLDRNVLPSATEGSLSCAS